MKKKFLALVLALTMVLALLPVTAMAVGDTYTITLDSSNYTGVYYRLNAYTNAGVRVGELVDEDGTISVPKDGYVEVGAVGDFTVAADGATVGELQVEFEELKVRKITNFTKDTTIVINPTAAPADTYTITLDRTNYDGSYLELIAYAKNGINPEDKIAYDDTVKTTLLVPKDGYVLVQAIGNFTVAADGATVGDMQESELNFYEITNFTKDTTIVINPTAAPTPSTYTVTFDPAGATGPVPTQPDTEAGGKFKLPGAGDMEKPGYAFYGWKIGNTIYQANKTYTMPAENVTFTAHWLRKPTVEINSFNVLDDIVTGIRTLEINYTLTNRHTEEMTYDLWWRLATSTNGKIVAEKGPTHTLAGGEVYSGTLLAVIPANKADDVILHAAQLRLHVRNEGSSSGSGDLTYFVLKTVQDNIHHGKYVTLDNNGGLYAGVDTNPKIFVDTAKKYGSVHWVDTSLYSKDGYTFLGHDADADATTPDYPISAPLSEVNWAGSEINTWYAIWAPNQYTVKFHSNDGEGTMADQPFVYDAAQNLSANTFTKTGYTFKGWATTPDGAVEYEDNKPVRNLATSGNVDLYAVWERNTYNVAVDASDDGGTVFVAPTALYNSNVSVAITSASGYKVNKVQLKYNGTTVDLTNNSSSATSFESSFTMPAADVELAVEFIRLTTDVELPVERKTYYFVEHYVENWDGSYTLVETEVLSGEIDATVTADSTKYDDDAHHVNTTKSTLEGVVSFDLNAANPMETVLTLKVYYDRTIYPSYDPTPVIPSVDVDIHNDSLSDAAKAVGSAVKSGTADITPVAGYTKESIAQMQKDNALKMVVEKKNSYDPAEKSLIDKAAQEKGKTSLVQFLEIDVTLRTMNDVIVAEVDDTVVPLTITVELNAEMQKAAKEGKTIYVARAHDGKVTFIEGTLNAEKTQFTFDSSKFSTYALVAFDSQTVISPKTADAGIFMAVSMSILSVTGSAVLLKKKED